MLGVESLSRFQIITLGLLDILKLAGFDASHSKMVRHKDGRYPLRDLLHHDDWFELYQQYQGRPVFDGIRAVVSFYGLSGTRAAFYGVYLVSDRRPAQEGAIIGSCEWSRKWNREAKFFYTLEREAVFDSFRHRLVIDWGRGTRSWVQKLTNKPVIEIQEPGRRLPPFEDYLEFSLTHAQLKDLFENEGEHRDWRTHLSAVGGVYLILSEPSGTLYVGSACGTEGIWGRWREYAINGHGGNVQLHKLIENEPDKYPARFRFSLLHILPKTMARGEVLKREELYKQKLGTRATGLN